uniref:CCHC-type domain-containing protein n=1 Tax=Oryzias sinensis TaxID=183150 RepID=A0A8C7ZGC4_9TELE
MPRPSQRHPLPSRRQHRSSDRCYRCGEPGHIARNCPAPAPKTRRQAAEDMIR